MPNYLESIALLFITLATASLFWIIPESPLAHLDNPSHWGILGYAFALVVLLSLRWRNIRGSARERRLLTVFLLAMPLIYVANWVRFGSSSTWLWIELAGLALYWAIALASLRSALSLLAVGIALHGIWDLAHFQQTSFVPDWYTLACAVIDFSLGFYVWTQLGYFRKREEEKAVG